MHEFHPLSELFPLIEGADFAGLVEDIRARGLSQPIVLYQGKILDGRNRYRACSQAGIECRFETYEGADPVGHVVSLNLLRRHLDESQRAMVAAKLATMRQGERTDLEPSANLPKVSQENAARLLNVSDRTVRIAKAVQRGGAPELIRAVEQGEVSVSAAADLASLSAEEQRKIIARGEREILRAAREIRRAKAEERRQVRNQKLVRLSHLGSPLPSDRRYPVIYADPPYRYKRKWSVSRDIENHYPTMSTEEICDFPVADLATTDAMLFLWSPAPLLTSALEILRAWGFEYVTSAVWVKEDGVGMGVYVRQQHELLLICKRGQAIVPNSSLLSSSVITAPRREHSRKPDEAYEMIERMYPDLPKIELFARSARGGLWDAWGQEVSKLVANDAA